MPTSTDLYFLNNLSLKFYSLFFVRHFLGHLFSVTPSCMSSPLHTVCVKHCFSLGTTSPAADGFVACSLVTSWLCDELTSDELTCLPSSNFSPQEVISHLEVTIKSVFLHVMFILLSADCEHIICGVRRTNYAYGALKKSRHTTWRMMRQRRWGLKMNRSYWEELRITEM